MPDANGNPTLEELQSLLAAARPKPIDVNAALPPPIMPPPPNYDVIRGSLDKANQAGLVHNIANRYIPGTYGVMHGRQPQDLNPGNGEILQQAAMAPAKAEMAKYQMGAEHAGMQNQFNTERAKLGVQAQIGEDRMASGELRGLLTGYFGLRGRQLGAGAQVEAAKIRATSPETAVNQITGQEYNKHAMPGQGGGGAPPYDKRMDKMLGDLRTDLSGVGRGDQRLKQQQQIYDRADRLAALAQRKAAGGNLDRREIEELAIGLNSMLQGSNVGAERQVQALVPRSIYGDAAKLTEYLSGNPQGTNQQEFVKRMMSAVQSERDMAAQKMQGFQHERLPAHIQTFRLFPEESSALLKSYGISAQTKNGHVYVQNPDGTVEEF